jgi:hypothetical protein
MHCNHRQKGLRKSRKEHDHLVDSDVALKNTVLTPTQEQQAANLLSPNEGELLTKFCRQFLHGGPVAPNNPSHGKEPSHNEDAHCGGLHPKNRL